MESHQETAASSPGLAAGFRWKVPDAGYVWRRDFEIQFAFINRNVERPERLPAYIKDAPSGPWLADPGPPFLSDYPGHSYEPLATQRNLHRLFAALPTGDHEQALAKTQAFASRYGRLGVDEVVVMTDHEYSVPELGGESLATFHMAEHLRTWVREINRMRGVVDLLDAYLEADRAVLRKLIHWQTDPPAVVCTYRWPGQQKVQRTVRTKESAPDDFARWLTLDRGNEKLREPLHYFISGAVNLGLREHVYPKTVGGRGVELWPDSLLGAMWVTLADELTGLWRRKVCAFCGESFLPARRRDKKTCSDACRKRLSRSRQVKADAP